MNPFQQILDLVLSALDRLEGQGILPPGLDRARVGIEPPRDPSHGEAATNAAMVLAKAAGLKPMQLAEALGAELRGKGGIMAVSVAAPGFVNLAMAPAFWQRQVSAVLEAGADYGRSAQGSGRRVNVEYCSANPTGPLHVGHGRGTVFGDALASLLAFAGFEVTREYYVNDAGAQIETLARSLHHRYREAVGEAAGPLPEGFYPGDYLKPVAARIAAEEGRRWLDVPEGEWLAAFQDRGVEAMLALIKADLAALGVHHDLFVSERALVEAGAVQATLDQLDAQGLLYVGTLPPPKGRPVEDYEPAPQLLFRSSRYGDDSDRPLRRSTGAWTYFASDVAYHRDKLERGFGLLIDVLGADHGGYVKRMQAAVRALSNDRARLDAPLCQLVNLMDEGRPLKMSKRAGRIVSLRDVIEEVGRDVVRFIMLTRRNDAPLDFDLAKVTEQSKDNPVFYVQYAHARVCSVFRRLEEEGRGDLAASLAQAPVERLVDPAELATLRALSGWPRTVEAAAMSFEPHRIAFYLGDLAGAFHALWTRGNEDQGLRFLIPEDAGLTAARLAMLAAVRIVLANGLHLMGVEPLAELH